MQSFDSDESRLITALTNDMQKCGVSELELQVGARVLRLCVDISDGRSRPDAVARSRSTVTSPGVGQYLDHHPLRPSVESAAGAFLSAGDVVGFIRTGDLLRPVTVSVAGRLIARSCSPGELVSFGTPVAQIELER